MLCLIVVATSSQVSVVPAFRGDTLAPTGHATPLPPSLSAIDHARGDTATSPLTSVAGNNTALGLSNWLNLSTLTAPSPRWLAAFAYDATDNYAVLFGGISYDPSCFCSRILNDTWIFSTGSWKQLHPSPSPPARDDASVTFDTQDGRVLLFGGSTATKYLNDTWEFEHGNWSQVHTAASPTPREGAGLAYYSSGGYAVLYAGYGINASLLYPAQTWEFMSGQWTLLCSGCGPGVTYDSPMADDPACNCIVISGYNSLFKNGSWSNFSGPNLGYGSSDAVSYYPPTRSVIMFGGHTTQGAYADTGMSWAFLPNESWIKLSPIVSPEAREGMTMVADASGNSLVMFGGSNATSGVVFNDTWRFGIANVTVSATPTGTGSIEIDQVGVSSGPITLGFGSHLATGVNRSWSYFGKWSSSGAVAISFYNRSPVIDFTVLGNGTLSASFGRYAFLTLQTNPGWCSGLSIAGRSEANGSTYRTIPSNLSAVAVSSCLNGLTFSDWGWSGSAVVQSPRNASTSIQLDGNATLRAAYVALVEITIAPLGKGSVMLNGTDYVGGAEVRLDVGTYGVGARWGNWVTSSGLSASGYLTLLSKGSQLFVNGSGSLSLRLKSLVQLEVSVPPAGNCSNVTVNGTTFVGATSVTVVQDSVILIDVGSCPGAVFRGLSTSAGVTAHSIGQGRYMATVTSNATLEVSFLETFCLRAQAAPTDGGELAINGTLVAGSSCWRLPAGNYTLADESAPGYHFVAWATSGSVGVAASNLSIFGQGVLTAEFAANSQGTNLGGNASQGGLPIWAWALLGGTIAAGGVISLVWRVRRKARSEQMGDSDPN